MAKCAIVIPCYNPTELNYNIIKSYENLDTDGFDIFVVDNMSTNTEFIEKIKLLNVKYELSEFNGGYETGALYQIYKKTKYDTYFLIQDSIQIKSFNFIENYSDYHSSYALAFTPIFSRHNKFDWGIDNEFLNEDINEVLKQSDAYDGIMCNAFGIKSYLLERIFRSNLFSEKIIPKHKFDSMAWEGCWAVLFQYFRIPVMFVNSYESSECKYFKKIFQQRQ